MAHDAAFQLSNPGESVYSRSSLQAVRVGYNSRRQIAAVGNPFDVQITCISYAAHDHSIHSSQVSYRDLRNCRSSDKSSACHPSGSYLNCQTASVQVLFRSCAKYRNAIGLAEGRQGSRKSRALAHPVSTEGSCRQLSTANRRGSA